LWGHRNPTQASHLEHGTFDEDDTIFAVLATGSPASHESQMYGTLMKEILLLTPAPGEFRPSQLIPHLIEIIADNNKRLC
jgi:hypothetical protein